MIYRTLHWYIFREMLRIFFMTCGALTTLMAFGGMFRPLTKLGVELSQLLVIMTNLMPAMLAYSIPVSALFAAVLVYWRMSTDNELTACRAGGISFSVIVAPAFALGLIVASVDMVFVHFVVPRYLQATERAVMRDLGSLLAAQIGKQEPFRYGKLVVYADSASVIPGSNPRESIVLLQGMAATPLGKDNQPTAIVIAEEARLTISEIPGRDETKLAIALNNAAAYNPATFDKIQGSVSSIAPGGKDLVLPSQLRTKPKFLNFRQLNALNEEPYLFPPVKEVVDRIEQTLRYQEVSKALFAKWQASGGATPLVFTVHSISSSSPTEEIRVYAPIAALDSNFTLYFGSNERGRVRVERYVNGRLASTYAAENGELTLAMDDYLAGGMNGALELKNQVTHLDHINKIDGTKFGNSRVISGLVIPPALYTTTPTDRLALLRTAETSPTPSLRELSNEAKNKIGRLFQAIQSETHSRMSFAVSCFTLVLLGAALGILAKGQNPLAVFVLGVMPSAFLMLLITAGRQLAEDSPQTKTIGLIIIWAGNGFLIFMTAIVYGKLFRK